MARTKKEIENQLKDFYERLKIRMEENDVLDEYDTSEEFTVTGDYEWQICVYIPEAIYKLLPDWESGWDRCDYVNDSYGIGFLGVDEDDDPDEEAKELYGVDSVDELNDIYYKVFFAFEQKDYRWWISLGDEIKGKTGLPNESVEIEG